MAKKLSQRQVVASIEPAEGHAVAAFPRFDDYFAQVSGGEITAAVEKVYDGGARFPETLCAPADIGDITLTRHYETLRDGSPLGVLRPLVGEAYYNITIVELDCDLANPASQRLYTNALCVGMTETDGDASSGAPAVYSLTFSIGPLAS